MTYNVTLVPGIVTTMLQKTVTITVDDGTISNGELTGTVNYTYSGDDDNDVSTALGTLTVTLTNDNQHTTVTIPTNATITKSGDSYIYTKRDNTNHTITTYVINVVNLFNKVTRACYINFYNFSVNNIQACHIDSH